MAKKKVITPDESESTTVSPELIEKAKPIFTAMPHIHSIWFGEDGHHRFYETPGSVAVHKADVAEDIEDSTDDN